MTFEKQSTPVKQEENKKKWFDYWKEYRWQQWQSWNPKGRPVEKTLKEFAREFLANMSEEGRIEYFQNIDPETVWKMAEWNPKQDNDITSNWKTIPVLVKFIDNDGKDNRNSRWV